MKSISISQYNNERSLNTLFTSSAVFRCSIAILLLAFLWLSIYWSVTLP